jgi:hypothetical protein
MSQIVTIDFVDRVNKNDDYGDSDFEASTITIKKSLEKQLESITFFHELNHWKEFLLGSKEDYRDHEAYIDIRAQIDYQISQQIQNSNNNKPNKNIKPPKYQTVNEGGGRDAK